MENNIVFLKLNEKVKIKGNKVFLKDVAKIYCRDDGKHKRIKEMEVYTLLPYDKGVCVISVLKVIEMIQKKYPELSIDSIGETAVIVEQVKERTGTVWMDYLKITVVSGICFFGTFFTIMAYHNDIGILNIFQRVNEIINGTKGNGFSFLEISYSLGLSLGIIIFYNHIGKRKLTQDPTPIAVEMRTYEADVNKALVEQADREGKTIDVI